MAGLSPPEGTVDCVKYPQNIMLLAACFYGHASSPMTGHITNLGISTSAFLKLYVVGGREGGRARLDSTRMLFIVINGPALVSCLWHYISCLQQQPQ